MKIKNLLISLAIALVGGFVSVFIYARLAGQPTDKMTVGNTPQSVYYAALNAQGASDVSFPDFTYPAEKAIHCVVHVRVKSTEVYSGSTGNPWFDYFFGPQQRAIPRQGSGSGVIISGDGYIITNNHVIDGADEIEVALNDKRKFPATLVGTDPTTDIALLKVNQTGLPFLTFGNSEALRVGEWVLAVGNPFNLTSTVTAGIVSAKARNVGIISSNQPRGYGYGQEQGKAPSRVPNIEAYIQTDAAVNPGNSGGALVNTKGELVGINAAIISQTGNYAGISFAIPVSIAQKVVADLKEFGTVQRAMLGLSFSSAGAQQGMDENEKPTEDLEVQAVSPDGGAEKAGIKEKDIIRSLNGVPVNTFGELQEQLSKYRPGDKIDVTFDRDGKSQTLKVTLYNPDGTTKLQKSSPDEIFGAKFEGIKDKDKKNLRIRSGVKMTEVNDGKFKDAGIRAGYIITQINDYPVNSPKEVKEILDRIEPNGRVMIDGIYPNGRVAYYGFAK